MTQNSFWNKFYQLPLEKIPWQRTQADWFKELVDSGVIQGHAALDLGCGTGIKSLYLAQHGFEKVVGVDIAPKAIEIARQNAEEQGLSDKAQFVCNDATDLSSLSNQNFDFILDWALLHCLRPEQRSSYVQQIEKVSKQGTQLLVRVFSSPDNEKCFEEEIDGSTEKIWFCSESELINLFNCFKVLKKNQSRPKTKSDYYFTEVLFQKA